MSKIKAFSVKTNKKQEVNAPAVFSKEKENLPLLAQAIHVYRNRDHVGTKYVKGRSDVKRTTKKMYRQKGTGGARHGARSAPIFVGGGKAHGPDGLKRVLTLPKKMRAKALGVALNIKLKADKIVLVQGISDIKKTKEAASILTTIRKEMLQSKKSPKTLVVLSDKNKDKFRFFQNIANCEVVVYKDLNAYGVYLGGLLIFDNDIFAKTKTTRKVTKK